MLVTALRATLVPRQPAKLSVLYSAPNRASRGVAFEIRLCKLGRYRKTFLVASKIDPRALHGLAK